LLISLYNYIMVEIYCHIFDGINELWAIKGPLESQLNNMRLKNENIFHYINLFQLDDNVWSKN